MESRFFDYLLESNSDYLDGFKKWLFHPGMLFNSREEWWGDRKHRVNSHEGIDLCHFEDALGQVKTVAKDLRIPATFPGTIVKVDHDFLGQSIYLRHDISSESGGQLYTIYGHLKPCTSLEVGQTVGEGEIIAEISDPAGKKARVPPHLHLSLAWIPATMDPAELNWKNLSTDPAITLIDPLSIL